MITFGWLYKPFGGRTSGRKFANTLPTFLRMDTREGIKVLWSFLVGSKHRKPKRPLPMQSFDPSSLVHSSGVKFVWIGHSALYLTWHGKTILIDPMFGKSPTPFPWLAGQRYSGGLPFELERLPMIDVVFLSHDHYDHLDYGTIQRIKPLVKHYVVPLGVGAHLQRWGVHPDKITELAWWEEREWEGLRIACTPARHFSGRRLIDRDQTLWCSWVIGDQQTRLFCSGDSGYGPHFAEIGKRYGPFDMSFIECGQYDRRWREIHMMPEETVQAALDIRTERMVPIHWAAFTLALHDWFDPPERVVAEAERLGVRVITPLIGETLDVTEQRMDTNRWWRTAY
jgi:L-ascorbate metabolism protein UlaG (beta-lactamase superfamily)